MDETLRHAFARTVTQFDGGNDRTIDAIEALLPEDLASITGADLAVLLLKISEVYACGFTKADDLR